MPRFVIFVVEEEGVMLASSMATPGNSTSLVLRSTDCNRACADGELGKLGHLRRWERSKGLLDARSIVDAATRVDWSLHIVLDSGR